MGKYKNKNLRFILHGDDNGGMDKEIPNLMYVISEYYKRNKNNDNVFDEISEKIKNLYDGELYKVYTNSFTGEIKVFSKSGRYTYVTIRINARNVH